MGKKTAVQTVQSLRSVQAGQADQCLRVQSSNTRYPAAVKSILDFGFRQNHRSNLRNHFAMCRFEF
jgi:hypothetical protein